MFNFETVGEDGKALVGDGYSLSFKDSNGLRSGGMRWDENKGEIKGLRPGEHSVTLETRRKIDNYKFRTHRGKIVVSVNREDIKCVMK